MHSIVDHKDRQDSKWIEGIQNVTPGRQDPEKNTINMKINDKSPRDRNKPLRLPG